MKSPLDRGVSPYGLWKVAKGNMEAIGVYIRKKVYKLIGVVWHILKYSAHKPICQNPGVALACPVPSCSFSLLFFVNRKEVGCAVVPRRKKAGHKTPLSIC